MRKATHFFAATRLTKSFHSSIAPPAFKSQDDKYGWPQLSSMKLIQELPFLCPCSIQNVLVQQVSEACVFEAQDKLILTTSK